MEEVHNDANYAYLPEDLLGKILEHIPITVDKMNRLFDIQDQPIQDGMETLRKLGLIVNNDTKEFSKSLIAVDGGVVLEKMSGTDILLAVAVGVEGLGENTNSGWPEGKNQYYQWQTVLAHDEANARLCQGIMFLMEMSVLASSSHEIRIMDGTHFTPILKVNSLLSAKEDSAGEQYITALEDFLRETYKKIIPDIPDIIQSVLNDERIIAIAKYSSSRDVIDAFLGSHKITIDDKTFFSLALNEDEFLVPLSVGQSKQEQAKVWDDLHIKCNLDIPEQIELNNRLDGVLKMIRTKGTKPGDKKSNLYYTYYKPYQDGPAYRIELKKTLADDSVKLKKYLHSIKKQIVFPEIREPYPQYLVDLMAKSVAGGLYAIQEAIRLSPDLKLDGSKLNLLFHYRT